MAYTCPVYDELSHQDVEAKERDEEIITMPKNGTVPRVSAKKCEGGRKMAHTLNIAPAVVAKKCDFNYIIYDKTALSNSVAKKCH